MPDGVAGIAGLDPLIHELTRLRICALLAAARALGLGAVRDSLELSDSVLSKHVKKLVEAGYVESKVRGAGQRGRPPTWLSLTRVGRRAYAGHVAGLRALANASADPVETGPD